MGTIFVGKNTGKFPFAAALNLLSERTLARTLAEPTLVAVSGQTASFLAGGEYPVPVSGSAFSAPSVDYKPVGVEMSFHPTVLDDDTIELVTTTQVTARDPTLDNGTLAGFKKRMSSTTVRLRDGQSFAVAGVLTDDMENTLREMPGLGQLPILGLLFSSKDFQRRQTELIVVVTARLAEPLDPGQLPTLPGQDRVNDPSDLELFLLNLNEIDAPRQSARPSASGGSGVEEVEGALLGGRPVGPIGFWR
jgi:pilus assembly protein CpaC